MPIEWVGVASAIGRRGNRFSRSLLRRNEAMDQIRKQVDRARRRLWLELFLGRLVKCWFFALLAAVIAIAVPKLVTIEHLPAQWAAWWLGGSVAAGALVALLWTWVNGRTEL